MVRVSIFLLVLHLSASAALKRSVIKNPEPPREEEIYFPFVVIFIALGNFICVLLRAFSQAYRIPIPYSCIVVIVGCLFGGLSNVSSFLDNVTGVVEVHPLHWISVALPILFFNIAFYMDTHTFLRSWMQILIISTVSNLICSTITGGLMSLVIGHTQWMMRDVYIFGLLISPIYPLEVAQMLKELGHHTKHLVILLEGESIIAAAFSLTLVYISRNVVKDRYVNPYYGMFHALWIIFFSPVLGFLFGKIMTFLIHIRYNNHYTILSWTVVFPYLSYFVSENLDCSGPITVIILGLMMGLARHGLTAEVDLFLSQFWACVSYIVYTIMILVVSTHTTRVLVWFLAASDYPYIVMTYVIRSLARFLSLLLVAPLLSRFGYGFTLNKLVVLMWSGVANVITVVASGLGMDNEYEDFGVTMFSHISGVYFLTVIINASTIPVILRILDISELSLLKKTNMNNCIKFILARRDTGIGMLKMDRFLSDANWVLVNKYTKIKNPFQIELREDKQEEETDVVGFHQATCPDCKQDIVTEPSAKEMRDMLMEARLRILKAKKISYSRQYENGLLSKYAIRALQSTIEQATDSADTLVKLDGLFLLLQRKSKIYILRKRLLKSFFAKSTTTLKMPKQKFRVFCYHLLTSSGFYIAMFVVIALNVILIVIEFIMGKNLNRSFKIVLTMFDMIFLLIYASEFIIKVSGFSYIHSWTRGLWNYFKSVWNIFDFLLLLICFTDAGYSMERTISMESDRFDSKFGFILLILKMLRVLKFLTLLTLCKACYPKLVAFCDSRIDTRVSYAYEVGKGFVTGENEVVVMLPQMIVNVDIREDMRRRMDYDRMRISRELGILQKERPWITTTVKTKQAMKAILNAMKEAIIELRTTGWADDVEYRKISEALEERAKHVQLLKSISPSEPRIIFNEILWMNSVLASDLYPGVRTKVFDQGDVVCCPGQLSEGIFIVVTGILKMTYTPFIDAIEDVGIYGCLPIIDQINSQDFFHEYEEYFMSGNTLGERSILTNRPYNSTVIAETPAQVFVLDRELIRSAMEKYPDPLNGLECNLWRYVSLKMCLHILAAVPGYHSKTFEKIKTLLQRSFVPNLSFFKVFTVNEMIEDIVLLEGVVVDDVNKHHYIAPCYIPRTVKKLVLIRSATAIRKTEPKLLIIPVKDSDSYELMFNDEQISQLVSNVSLKCLQHFIRSKLQLDGRKKSKYKFAKSEKSLSSYLSEGSNTENSRHGDSSEMERNSGFQKRGSIA